jgi:hypothetical protein
MSCDIETDIGGSSCRSSTGSVKSGADAERGCWVGGLSDFTGRDSVAFDRPSCFDEGGGFRRGGDEDASDCDGGGGG